jgi:hypothetical protein
MKRSAFAYAYATFFFFGSHPPHHTAQILLHTKESKRLWCVSSILMGSTELYVKTRVEGRTVMRELLLAVHGRLVRFQWQGCDGGCG